MKVVIGLGANLGNRISTLREAVRRIALITTVLDRSRVFESAPIGGPTGQGDFLNAALLVDWSESSPSALLGALLEIERDLGRVRDIPNGPRTIDLDILWADGGFILEDPRLVVPHPRLPHRAFALAPLLDVARDAIDPRSGARYEEILSSLPMSARAGIRVSTETL